MSVLEMITSLVEYHCEFTRRVWESIDSITEEQFTREDAYSQGSIRNLMVHLSSTDRRWLAGLKNLADVGHVKFEQYPDRRSGRAFFEQVAADLMDYVRTLDETGLNSQPEGLPAARWHVLLHQVNHGTDHRATVLQKLHDLGAPTFSQDYILWLWKK
jgi:uncharacterized damage-inducible protein DinB